jgi:hypothetical protein
MKGGTQTMDSQQLESIRWQERFMAVRRYGAEFNAPPPDEECEKLLVKLTARDEADKEFKPPDPK